MRVRLRFSKSSLKVLWGFAGDSPGISLMGATANTVFSVSTGAWEEFASYAWDARGSRDQ